MKYRIQVAKSARKSLESLPKVVLERIEKTVDALSENPRPSGMKKLSGVSNLYRVRVGDYRIIYSVFDDILVVEIIAVGHRGQVYR